MPSCLCKKTSAVDVEGKPFSLNQLVSLLHQTLRASKVKWLFGSCPCAVPAAAAAAAAAAVPEEAVEDAAAGGWTCPIRRNFDEFQEPSWVPRGPSPPPHPRLFLGLELLSLMLRGL